MGEKFQNSILFGFHGLRPKNSKILINISQNGQKLENVS